MLNAKNQRLEHVLVHVVIIMVIFVVLRFFADIRKNVIYKGFIIDQGKVTKLKSYRCDECNAKTKLIKNNKGQWICVCNKSSEHNKRFDPTK